MPCCCQSGMSMTSWILHLLVIATLSCILSVSLVVRVGHTRRAVTLLDKTSWITLNRLLISAFAEALVDRHASSYQSWYCCRESSSSGGDHKQPGHRRFHRDFQTIFDKPPLKNALGPSCVYIFFQQSMAPLYTTSVAFRPESI